MYQTFPYICLERALKSKSKAERGAYINRAYDLCSQGLSLVYKYHYRLYTDYIKVAKAEVLMVDGKADEAFSMLQPIDHDKTIDALIRYYTITRDYQKLLTLMDEKQRSNARQSGAQFIISDNRNTAQAVYEEHCRKIAADNEKRELEFRLRERRLSAIEFVLIVLAVILLVVLIGFLLFFGNSSRISKVLSEQNQIISAKNHELEVMQQAISRQTSKLMEQSATLKSQTRSLRFTHLKLMEGMKYAKQIQDAAVPSAEMMNEIFGNCMIYWRPLMTVSGDFYWAARIKHFRLLAVCDCTGHGVPGALLSMLGISFLNDLSSQEMQDPNAANILGALRSMILREIGEECDDGMDMSLIIIDDDKNQIHYAGAMRPIYRLRGNDMQVMKPNRMPIGRYVVRNKPFAEQVFNKMPGDRFYLFSDGMTDVFTPDRSKKLNDKLFREYLYEHRGDSLPELKESLQKLYDDWGEQAIIDDQLLVVVEI